MVALANIDFRFASASHLHPFFRDSLYCNVQLHCDATQPPSELLAAPSGGAHHTHLSPSAANSADLVPDAPSGIAQSPLLYVQPSSRYAWYSRGWTVGQVSAQSLRARGLTSDRTTNIYRHKAQHMQKPQSTTVVPLRRVSLRVNKSSPNPTITFSAPSHQLQYIGALLQRLGSLKATQVAKYGNPSLTLCFFFMF